MAEPCWRPIAASRRRGDADAAAQHGAAAKNCAPPALDAMSEQPRIAPPSKDFLDARRRETGAAAASGADESGWQWIREYEVWPGRNVFCCFGHLMTGPVEDIGPNSCAWFLLLTPMVLFFFTKGRHAVVRVAAALRLRVRVLRLRHILAGGDGLHGPGDHPAERRPGDRFAAAAAALPRARRRRRQHGERHVVPHVQDLPAAARVALLRLRQLRARVRPPLPLHAQLHRRAQLHLLHPLPLLRLPLARSAARRRAAARVPARPPPRRRRRRPPPSARAAALLFSCVLLGDFVAREALAHPDDDPIRPSNSSSSARW